MDRIRSRISIRLASSGSVRRRRSNSWRLASGFTFEERVGRRVSQPGVVSANEATQRSRLHLRPYTEQPEGRHTSLAIRNGLGGAPRAVRECLRHSGVIRCEQAEDVGSQLAYLGIIIAHPL
jgi:hypothetical protein